MGLSDDTSPFAGKDAIVSVKSTDDGESWYEVAEAEVDVTFDPDSPMEPLGASGSISFDADNAAFDELCEAANPQPPTVEYRAADGETTEYEILKLYPAPIGFVRACELPDEVDALAEVVGGMTMALKEVEDE